MEKNTEAVTVDTDTKPDITDRFEVESNVESDAEIKTEVKTEVESDAGEAKEEITQEQEPSAEPPEVKPVNPRTLARRAEKERLIRENAVMAEMLKQYQAANKEPKTEPEASADPSKKPSMDDYDDVFEYQRAVIKHELYLDRQEQKQTIDQENERKQLDAFMQRAEIIRSEKPDFDERVGSLVDSNMLTPDIEKAMLSSDMSAEVSYHLAQYGADLMTLRGLPKDLLPQAIKNIEDFIKKPSEEKPRVTKATPPITPPGVTTKTNRSLGSYSQEEIENMPLAEFKRLK